MLGQCVANRSGVKRERLALGFGEAAVRMALLQNAAKVSGLARLCRGAAASLARATGQDLAPLSVAGYKTTTGIVGVEVDPQAPETLRKMLKQILRVSPFESTPTPTAERQPRPSVLERKEC